MASNCSCGGNTCKSLRCGSEIQKKDKAAAKSPRKFDLGPVPSPVEVDAAVTALQSYLQEVFSNISMSKWLQPVMNFNDSRILHSVGYQLIYKAFQWLRTDPSFKGMVVSLCMDKAVWNAIAVNNGFMENFRELPSSGVNEYPGSSKQGPDFGNIILRWILEMSLKKVVELIESFLILLNNAFHFPGKDKLTPEKKDDINEKIESAFVLSLVVMLMVVVARAQIA
ncbi:uncharacterized protein LOC111023503 [Momordica charantia]|uniref:Uncharacterized protein LOC111023503 n=1 Tax=Momordica charantia TaxID=3673 RepID=A0A6J1DU63_MOMCH|nr:uncharacterized protein LOC111023503 [Momordica charantia]